MADSDGNRHTLQLVFSFFLGLVVVAVIGVALRTFYPPPSEAKSELQTLTEQQKALDNSRRLAGSMSRSHEEYYEKISAQITAKKKVVQAGQDVWTRNTSIALIALATLLMGLSLVFARQLRVVSSGFLLGGLFTMLYGAAWSFTGGDSTSRYAIVAVAVIVIVAVGYVKFARTRKADTGAAPLEQGPPAPPAT